MNKTIGLAEGGGNNATNLVSPAGGSIGGSISLGTVIIRPVGISPSIHTAPAEHWFRGNQWPPENTEPPNGPPPHWATSNVRHFTPLSGPPPAAGFPVEAAMPPRAWDTGWYALVLLTEFALSWKPSAATATALNAILTAARSPTGQAEEERVMIELIEFRNGVMDEVVSQMTTFDAYFQGALAYTHATHPNTDYLVQGAMQVAGFVAMYYKNLFQRARPWQLWPQLMPPIQVPGHASFPSGHSTQSHTIAKVLQAVAAGAVPAVVDITERLAQRIARGRELLGLHYPSDTVAGHLLSSEIAATYLACPTVARMVTAAQNEWMSYTI
jgi:membrane-associated phospholipid phosphatase